MSGKFFLLIYRRPSFDAIFIENGIVIQQRLELLTIAQFVIQFSANDFEHSPLDYDIGFHPISLTLNLMWDVYQRSLNSRKSLDTSNGIFDENLHYFLCNG